MPQMRIPVFRSYGYTDGRQRHKCKDCGRTFSDKPKRSMIFTSKLPKSTWMKYINCFVDELPIANAQSAAA